MRSRRPSAPRRARRGGVGGSVIVAVVLAVVAVGAWVVATRQPPATGSARDAGRRPTGKLVPRTGALLGAFVSTTGTGWSADAVTAREAELGRRFAIDHRYQNWATPFPTVADRWDVVNGRIPMITWQPNTTTLAAIADGTSDELIRTRARSVAAFGHPIFLRWGHEMNADWYPWDGVHNNTPGHHDGPAAYVAAWRHVHDLFVAAGATNAVWIWCPNRVSIPASSWNRIDAYYPGDAYVDWVGFDGYNRDPADWRSFTTLFASDDARDARRKPVMVGEVASVEGRTPGRKAAWIRDVRAVLESSFPSVAAVVWFDTAKNGFDFRIDSSASSAAAFRELAQDPYFRSRP